MRILNVLVIALYWNVSSATLKRSTHWAKTSDRWDITRYVCNAELWHASVSIPFIENFVFWDQIIQLHFFQVGTVLKHHKITPVLCASAKCCGFWNRHFRKRSKSHIFAHSPDAKIKFSKNIIRSLSHYLFKALWTFWCKQTVSTWNTKNTVMV